MTRTISHDIAPWAVPLLSPKRYKVLYGGRGSGKSWAVATCLILLGAAKRIRVACVREFQNSIEESSKHALEQAIERLQLQDHFIIQNSRIICKNTHSYYFFRGLSKTTEQSIKGWEAIDIVWVEEAHMMSASSREILYNTIRKPGSEIWFTFNPRYRYDPVYIDFVTRSRPDSYVEKVNYEKNLWFPEELDRERKLTLEFEPNRYAHIWLGEPDDEGAARKVLPYELLIKAVDGWQKRVETGRRHCGLDIAEAGGDWNALVTRRGPCIIGLERWRTDIASTARRADARCRDLGAQALFYDVGGLGAGVRAFLREMGRRPYRAVGVQFGGAVEGGDVEYARNVDNADFFARRNAQLGWAVRLRAQRTQRLLDGDDIDPEECLFIDPNLPDLESFLAEMSQPEWDENPSGKMIVDKTPDDAPSPDRYDAAVLSFAADSRYGLRQAA